MRGAAARPPSSAFKHAMIVIVVLLLGVSGGMLWEVGYNYDGLTGSPATKIHPSTYLLFVAALWRAFAAGNPLRFGLARIAVLPAASWLLVLSILLLVLTALRGGVGLAGFIDTFSAPALLALLLADYGEADLKPLTATLHAMLAINAVMGLLEYAAHTQVFPFRLDGVRQFEDMRSTALQGHPLSNAALTGIYVIALMTGATSMSSGLRLALLLLQFAGLAVFGGRTAIVVALAAAPLIGLYQMFETLRRRRISLLVAAAAFVAPPLVLALVAGALSTGIADLLLLRFSEDSGSAATRVIMFELLKPFSWGELIAGPDLEMVETLRRRYGLEQGIENPFVRLTLYQGVFVMMTIFLSLIWFFRELLKRRGFGVLAAVIAMTVVLNAAESISSKTNILAKYVLIFVCLYPRRAPQLREGRKPSASTIAGSSARVRSSISPMPSNRHQKAQGKPYPSATSRTSLM